MTTMTLDPKLDLILERIIDVPPELVWEAWTKPEHMMKWFTPKPWTAKDCRVDLRPGGEFHLVMVSPEGQENPLTGCYLEIVENRKLVWTDALLPGFRPSEKPFFTGIVMIEPQGTGSKYTAIARHGNEATRKQHEAMGFHEGWGKCLDQLVEHVKKMTH